MLIFQFHLKVFLGTNRRTWKNLCLCLCLFSFLLPLFPSVTAMATADHVSPGCNGNHEVAVNIPKTPDQPTNNNNYDNRHQNPPPSSTKTRQDCFDSAGFNLSVSFIQKVTLPLLFPSPFYCLIKKKNCQIIFPGK